MHAHVHVYVRVCVCVYVRICVLCMCMHVYMCTHTHECDTYTRMHLQSKAKPVAAMQYSHTYPDKLGCLCTKQALWENPPGDGTSTLQEGCTCLMDDSVGTQSPT